MSVAPGDPLPLLRHVFPAASADERSALAAQLASAARWRFCRLPLQQLGAPDDAVDASVAWGQQVAIAHSNASPAFLVFARPWARSGSSGAAPPATHAGGQALDDGFFSLLVAAVKLAVTPQGLVAQPAYAQRAHFRRGQGPGAGALHAALPLPPAAAMLELLVALPSDEGPGGPAILRCSEGRTQWDPDTPIHDLRGVVSASNQTEPPRGPWPVLDGRRQLSTISFWELRAHPAVAWPSERLEPIALRMHQGKLLALCVWHALPGTVGGGTRLQVWEMDGPAADRSSTERWQLVEGSGIDLPAGAGTPGKLDVAPIQGCRWVVLLPGAAGAPAAAAAGAPAGATQQLLVYDMRCSSWSSHEAAAGDLLVREGLHHGTHQPAVIAAHFFRRPKEAGSAVGAAAAAAAAAAVTEVGKAAAACAEDARQLYGEREQLDAQRQQAVALSVSEADGCVTAAWQEWAPLPAVRLGEIAAPLSLPYDLRAAQAARAAAAAGSGRVLLRLAADPALPPLPCPLAAARQCSQLAHMLDLFCDSGAAAGEACGSSSGGGGVRSAEPRELPLAGVAAEEHAALRQLVACLAGQTHTGLLEGTLLLGVARLADLLNTPALLAECVAVLECMAPGPELYAPLFALAEARRFHSGLQRLRLCYRHALALDILEGDQPLLGWALHGLQAGADSILEVCTEVAASWLPLQPDLWLGSPEGDLRALAAPEWRAALAQQPQHLRPLLLAALEHAQRRLQAARQLQRDSASSAGARKKARTAPSGPFQPAAAPPPRPDPAAQHSLPAVQLAAALQQTLTQLARVLPAVAAAQRQQRTAVAFAGAEARARRQRQ